MRSNSNTHGDDNGKSNSSWLALQPSSPRSPLFGLRKSFDSTSNSNYCLKPERAQAMDRKGVSLTQFATRPRPTSSPNPSTTLPNRLDSNGTSKQERTPERVCLTQFATRTTATACAPTKIRPRK